jgi:hypothetical protein
MRAKTTALRMEVRATIGSVKKRRGGRTRAMRTKSWRDGCEEDGAMWRMGLGDCFCNVETFFLRTWLGRLSRMVRRRRERMPIIMEAMWKTQFLCSEVSMDIPAQLQQRVIENRPAESHRYIHGVYRSYDEADVHNHRPCKEHPYAGFGIIKVFDAAGYNHTRDR